MIGILCSSKREREYAVQLRSIFQNIRNNSDEPIIVFTILNIDLEKKKAVGSLISSEEIERTEVPLPKVIFNLAVQREMESIKIRKALEDMESIELVNDVNRFDQWMVMEMLSAFSSVKNYLLPYHVYNKEYRDFKPRDDKSYIVMPSKGASLSRMIFAKADLEADIITGSQYFKKGHICDYIDASMFQRRWLFIEVPDLLTRSNHPVIVRSYFQKNSNKKWMILGTGIHPNANLEGSSLIPRVNKYVLEAVEILGHFLTSLGHGFIDSVISDEGKAYFLHLGGFDEHFFALDEEVHKKFYENILDLSRYYKRVHKGE